MDAHQLVSLVAREVFYEEGYKIDTNNFNVTTKDPMYIKVQRKYCEPGKCPSEWATLHYQPTFIGNAIYLAMFVILLIAQLFFGVKHKTWNYLGAVSLGVIGEAVGYVGRLMLSKNNFPTKNFLMNLVPLTVAPALLTAGIYVCLARVITAIGAEHSRLKPKFYTFIFVGCDLLSLILQAAGGAMASMADDKKGSDNGVHIMIGGLVSQIISMIIFFALWGDFALRARKAKNSGGVHSQPPLYANLRATRAFHWFQWSLFIATVCIFIRSVYRVAELWGGFDSHLANDEPTFMIFEAPFIICAVSFMTLFHPGRVFGKLWVPAGAGVRSAPMGEFEENGSQMHLNDSQTEMWKPQSGTSYQRV